MTKSKRFSPDTQNQLLHDILEAIVHPFYIINVKDYSVEVANSAALKDATTVTALKCYAMMRGLDKPCSLSGQWPCPLKTIKEIKKPMTIEHVFVGPDGHRRYFEINAYPIFDEQGEVKQVIEHNIDITDRKRAEEERGRLHEQLHFEKQKLEQVLSIDQTIRSILNLNHLVDFAVEKAMEILDAERCSLMLLDTQSQELLIRSAKGLDERLIQKTRIKFGEGVAGMVAKEGQPLLVRDIEEDQRVARKNRTGYRSKSFVSVPIKLHDRLVGVINVTDKIVRPPAVREAIFTEVDLKILCAIVRQAAVSIENANYYRRLEHLSMTDSVTELFNHRYFIKVLDQEIERFKRYRKSLSLMMIDIDDFKSYNDEFGHLAGDDLLKEFGNILKQNLRSVDIVCRYAGDEFAVILPETDIPQGEAAARKIKEALEKHLFHRMITVSIGVGRSYEGMGRRDLVMKADQALYQSKRGGKNKISCFY